MKTTKLFTSLAALALVLGLGACTETTETETSSEESGVSSETGGTAEAGSLSNYTVAFSFVDTEGEPTTLPEYASAYIIGSWDSWGQFLPLTETDGVYSYTFASIDAGTYTYKGVMWYSDEAVSWDDCVEIITDEGKDASLTINEEDGDNYTQKIEITLTETLEEKPDPVVTYVITIGDLDPAPENITLYAAGDFNQVWNESSGYYEWGEAVQLINNGDKTYNFVLYELPEVNRSFEIVADDTTDETQSMWDYIVGKYTFTTDDVDVTGGAVKEITVTTEYTSWYEKGGVFPPLGEEAEEFYVAFINADSGDFTSYEMTFTADIDCWENGSSVASHTTISDGHYAFYSGAASYPSGAVTNFELSANGHSFKTTSAVTIPSNEQGTPIYIGICWVNGWQADNTYTTWGVKTDIAAAGWQYISEGTSVAEFLSSHTVSAYW